MSNAKLSVICMLVCSGLLSCAPPTSFPPPAPSPAWAWTIDLAQSGGFAGVNLTVRVDSNGEITARDVRRGREIHRPLADSARRELEGLLTSLRLRGPGGVPSVCADCFLYGLEIKSRGQDASWRGDDTTLVDSGAADLIRLLGRLRDEALSGAN